MAGSAHPNRITALTADIVTAYVAKKPSGGRSVALILNVHRAIVQLGNATPEPEPLSSAVTI